MAAQALGTLIGTVITAAVIYIVAVVGGIVARNATAIGFAIAALVIAAAGYFFASWHIKRYTGLPIG